MVGIFPQFYKKASLQKSTPLNYLYRNYVWEITLKRTSFELGVLITHAFLFQVFNATYNLEATW